MKRLLLILLLLPVFAEGQIITTYAGNGIVTTYYKGDGGLADTAELGYPNGLNFDNAGNLLICHETDLVRKVDKLTTIITTIAGSDTASSSGHGGDGGPATCAGIVDPIAVCVDAVGNYYIADNWYSEVRKVTIATGIIDTFAGNRNIGNTGDGGPAKNATFSSINDVCFDITQSYLYICDAGNNRVRRVNMLTNTITAFAGTGVSGFSGDGGPAINAQFSKVAAICIDNSGNFYIGDDGNHRIRRVDAATGIVTTIAGNGTNGFSGDGGPATNAMISSVAGICFDKCGNLYFSDEGNNRVRRIDMTTGIINTVAGNGIGGFGGDGSLAQNAELNHPTGVVIDSSGDLYIGDFYNYRVRKVTFPNPYDSISVASADTTCAGYPITLQVTTAVAGSIPSFQWFVNSTAAGTTGTGTYTYVPANGDSVSCILTSSSGCVGTPTVVSNTLHPVVNSTFITPTISIAGVSGASVGALVTITATVTNAGSSYNIHWYDNGVLFNTTTVPTVTYPKGAGTDNITSTVISTTMGCYDSTTSAVHIVTTSTTGFTNVTIPQIYIYPNPTTASLTIIAPEKITTIAITNLIGQSVYTHEYNAQQVQVDVAALPKGMYLIRINGSEVRKFVKQ